MYVYRWVLLFLTIIPALTGCMGGVWTGMNLVYTRHTVYKKVDDFHLALEANHLLFPDNTLKQEGAYLDLAVFNGDVLLAGHLPDADLRQLAYDRLSRLSGFRHLFKHVALSSESNNGVQDSWISTKIISQIIADADIDPSVFKIITSDRIVYIMGDVPTNQAHLVIAIARKTQGVFRVVKLLKYYKLSDTDEPPKTEKNL